MWSFLACPTSTKVKSTDFINLKPYYSLLKSNATGLPQCERTLLYQFDGNSGLGSELGIYATVAAVASAINYTLLIDDFRWNYGRLSDYFDLPPLNCQPPEDWMSMPRPAFSNAGVKEPPHIRANRHERDVCTKYLLDRVPKKTIDVQTVWNYGNYRDKKTVLPGPQNLHIGMKPVFDAKSEVIRRIWRPNQIVTRELDKMKEYLDKALPESRVYQCSESVTLRDQLDGKSGETRSLRMITVHIRMGDKFEEAPQFRTYNEMPMALGDPRVYFEVIRSMVPCWRTAKELPALFILSDNTEAIIKSFEEYQSMYWPHQRFKLLSPSDVEMITNQGFFQTNFNAAPHQIRRRLGLSVIRDISFAIERSDRIVCSMSSNLCNMLLLLRGSKDLIGSNPKVRSVDTRWYPTAFPYEISSKSLEPNLKSNWDQILKISIELLQLNEEEEDENYIEI
ncbi:hypothetical protein CROQUDRAFT_653977 [Cronartium quercuum f. sp. fusiforme G11]|uniref:Fucosyltransferase n=1 Tax=Cronartium quercuum f. sp. fusiforme G11 TaxID=708437 RepID=A0A9P6NNB8_9BASI|nr:hypothetical protein CROQUDRAFT_653977 [Cronartium quercuum f. sp. fusiforme G11]